jgi:tyrosinase
MNANQAQIKERLYNLLSGNTNFTEVGTSAWAPDAGPGSYDSFESIHDQIHGTIGGANYGDMSVIPVSAFDPAFWFHHAMIDRSFALWQSLYPDSYVEPMAQKQGSYWYSQGDTLDAETPLKPFYAKSDGTFWTASQVRSTATFGYTYAELQNADQSSIRSSINALYGPSNSNKKRRSVKPPNEVSGVDGLLSKAVSLLSTFPDVILHPRRYQINYRAPKNTLDKTYYLDFFLGEPSSEDPTTWLNDLSLIGSQAILSMDRPGQQDVTVTGIFPLNSKLQELVSVGGLVDLLEDLVIELLKDKITWRVRSVSSSISDSQ